MESKIADLINEIKSLNASVPFLNGKHDELTNNYNGVVCKYYKQTKDIKFLNKHANDIQNKIKNDKIKIDKLVQYERRQTLEFHQVTKLENEDVPNVVQKLAKNLDATIVNDNISIAHRLPKKSLGRTRASRSDNKHPPYHYAFRYPIQKKSNLR